MMDVCKVLIIHINWGLEAEACMISIDAFEITHIERFQELG